MVEERIRGPVDDAHHERPCTQVVATVPEYQMHGGRGYRGASRVASARPRRSEESGGERLAVADGAGIVGTEGLQEIEELLAGVGVVLHAGQQGVEEDLDSVGRDLHALGGEPRLGGRHARLGRLGYAGEELECLGRGSPGGQEPGQSHHAGGVIGLELEGPSQRRLVAQGDQLIGLRGSRRQPGDELRDLSSRGWRR